ncbi:3-epi-6-deoxocathasterone 23-monooxygenase -like protein [Gossypium arboreum]|uniref:3-epi-6-deoxocathasterone 23-monooxygenase-like protein n=1 Tax=Gossypium arboreum TaxID=29729 RepID=A0A0B0NP43_GOSAR|nr:3-epi-6-deoxocathasterone 23-monooxygenase -like protein [Gossypium arboreum]
MRACGKESKEGENHRYMMEMMSSLTWIIVFVTAISLSILFLYTKSKSKFSSLSSKNLCHLPLGTLGWPFLGETIDFISCAYSDRPESFMDSRRRLYGKVFKSHIFGTPTIVSTDAEVSRFVLQSDAKAFVPFYPKSLTELMGKSSILLINGSLQRKIHGLVGSFFKSPHLKDQITRDMQNYVQQAMDKWRDDAPIFIQDETKTIAFQVLVKALISLNPGEEMEILKKQFQEFISGLMSLPAKKRMVKIVHKIIQTKRDSSMSSMVPKDVVDVLLKDASELLTDDLIADNMIDMMIPGEDSDENLKLKRLKAQNGEPLIWSDYLSLPFTQNVITETLRMGNIIIGVMRKAMKDIEIKGLCPGLDLARLETSIFLHHFVTNFRWVAEEDTIVNFPTVRMKKRMPVWVKRREE